MIKVYDTEFNYLGLIDTGLKDVYTIKELSNGQQRLHFRVPINEFNLTVFVEENYIITKDYAYIIKEINFKDNAFMEVFCSADLEELKGLLIENVDILDSSLEQAFTYLLTGTGWTLSYNSENRTVITYQEPMKHPYDVITEICSTYLLDFWFDTKEEVLHIYDIMGNYSGQFYSNELRMQALSKQGNSYNYITVLYPIGKDGLTIRDINYGRDYISNFAYSDKIIEEVKYWDDIDKAEILLELAKAYLTEVSTPIQAFSLTLSTIGLVGIGDTIKVIDKIKRIKQYLRVVKIIDYPFEPERSSIEVATIQADFSKTYIARQKQLDKDLRWMRREFKELRESLES